MDRSSSRPASPGYGRRGVYAQQQHSHGASSAQTSPVHRHTRSGSLGGAGSSSTVGRRGAGAAAGAAARNSAAQRLARVMGGGGGGGGGGGDAGSGSDDEEYELSGPPIELSTTPRRPANRSASPSPSIGCYLADQTPVSRPPSLTNRYVPGKSVPMIPSIKQTNRPATSGPGSESSAPNRREQRRSVDLGSSMRGRRSSSSLNDEINTLQMENDSMYEKLQLEDDRSDEADVKSINMERQAGTTSA